MAKKSVNDPGSLGWTDDGNGFWSWSGDGDGSDCAGMVVSATEPTDPIEGMQWLNSDTAEVFIFDGAVWLEFPAGSGGSGGSSLWEQNGDDIYYNDGNVGVGTSDISGLAGKPTIHVNDGSGNGAIRIGNVNSAGGNVFLDHSDADGARIRANSTDLNIGSSSAHNLNLFTGDTRTTRLTIDAAGNVGVGENSPDRKLTVKDSKQVVARIESTGGASWLAFSDAGSSDSIGVRIGSVADDFKVINSGQENLTIDAAGNVGIGMTPVSVTFDLSAKEQLAEWKTKAKKASWPIVTDGAFEQEPTEDLVAEWMETRLAGDRLQVSGTTWIARGPTSAQGIRFESSVNGNVFDGHGDNKSVTIRNLDDTNGSIVFRHTSASTPSLDLKKNGDADFSGSVTATRKDNSGAPTSTKDPAILLMGGDSSAGDGGEIGFGAFTNRKFAAIKGFISDGNGNGAGHLDFYTRENPNTAEMSRALRIASNRDAEFTGSVSIGRPDSGVAKVRIKGTGNTGNTWGLAVENSDGTSSLYVRDDGNAYFRGKVDAPTFTVNGSPLTRTVDLIKTLSTLRQATMDETQDIRESLRSAIDELVEGFEQEIATMPAGDSE